MPRSPRTLPQKAPMEKRKPNNLCETCPRRLTKHPTEACPLALQRIEALQAVQQSGEKKKELDDLPGCPWYTTSAEHHYCFWNQVATDDPHGRIDPLDDKEIMDSLGLTQAQVDRTFASGLAKLKSQRDTPEFQEMKEQLADLSDREVDNSVYLPDSFIQAADGPDGGLDATEIDEEPAVKAPPRRKVQLYGLYSQKKLQEMKNEADSKSHKKK